MPMNAKQIGMLIARHEPVRARLNLSWEYYLYKMIQDGESAYEIFDITSYVGVPITVQAELEIRIYQRAGNMGAVARATERYTRLFANSA